jgi:hypothetical protein
MAEETQIQTVRIGDKHYDASKLTDKAVSLFNDIAKIDGELGRLGLQTSIAELAKGALVEQMVAETANLTDAEIQVPAEA